MRAGLAFCIGVSLAASPASAKSLGMPADLALALDAYNRATIHSDIKVLATIVTEDYMLVNSDSSVQDKRSYLADFAMPGFKLDPYLIEQPVARVVGAAALTGGIFRLGWTQDGRHQTRHLRIAHFWVKRGGHWRINYTQLTRIPD